MPSNDIMFRSHARVISNKATLEIQRLCLSSVVCKLYSPFSVEPNLTTLTKQVTVQCEDTNKFRVFACDIPLCYDSILCKFCVSQTSYIYTVDFMCLNERRVST